MSKQFLIITLVLTAVLFQNFSSSEMAFDAKYKVNDEARRSHAKELLGNKFKKSPASKEADEYTLSIEIYNLVQRNTKRRYQYKVEKMVKAILEEANRYDIDPIFVASIIRTESSFNPLARGTSGEIGLMQLMPKTGEYIAKRVGIKNYQGAKTLKDPVKNIEIGVAYLHYLRQKFDHQAYKYVPAYNMGPGNVMKSFARQERPKIYASKVIQFYESFYKQIYASEMIKNPYLAQK